MNTITLESGESSFAIDYASYCCSDSERSWAVFARSDMHLVSRAAMDAIHRMTTPDSEGYYIRLTDFEVSLSKRRNGTLNLHIQGWGINFTSCEMTPDELAAVHAMTSPDNLDKLQADCEAEEARSQAEYEAEEIEQQRIAEEAAEAECQ